MAVRTNYFRKRRKEVLCPNGGWWRHGAVVALTTPIGSSEPCTPSLSPYRQMLGNTGGMLLPLFKHVGVVSAEDKINWYPLCSRTAGWQIIGVSCACTLGEGMGGKDLLVLSAPHQHSTLYICPNYNGEILCILGYLKKEPISLHCIPGPSFHRSATYTWCSPLVSSPHTIPLAQER